MMSLSDIEVLSIALVASALLWLFPRYMRHRSRHLREVTNHLGQMIESSRFIIVEPKTPELVVSFVRRATQYSTNPGVSRFVIRKVLSGDFFDAAQRTSEDKSPLGMAIESMDPPNKRQFRLFVSNFVLSSASSDPFFSAFSRRIMLFGLMKDTAHEVEGEGRDQALAVEATFALPDGDALFRQLKDIERNAAMLNRKAALLEKVA